MSGPAPVSMASCVAGSSEMVSQTIIDSTSVYAALFVSPTRWSVFAASVHLGEHLLPAVVLHLPEAPMLGELVGQCLAGVPAVAAALPKQTVVRFPGGIEMGMGQLVGDQVL